MVKYAGMFARLAETKPTKKVNQPDLVMLFVAGAGFSC
jgi:hypothetical protein